MFPEGTTARTHKHLLLQCSFTIATPVVESKFVQEAALNTT